MAVAGCQKSDEPPKQAVTAKGGLMPVRTPEPRVPVSAVADQKQVKMIERTVSYEPLDTFIAKNAAGAEKAGKAKGEKAAAKSSEKKPAGKKGLFGRLKSGLGAKVGGLTQLGGAALGGPGMPPPDAAGKGDKSKDGAKAKKAGEEEEEGDDEAEADDDTDEEDDAKDADEEESDEDSADENESDDEAEEDDSEDDEDDSDKDDE